MADNVYDKARAVLKERGWGTGSGETVAGRVCILGAVAIAKGIPSSHIENVIYGTDMPETLVLADVIREQYPREEIIHGYDLLGRCDPESIPWRFNDSVATSEAEVDLVLDKAARWLDERVTP